MEFREFVAALFDAAEKAGMEAYEAYEVESESFRVTVFRREVEDYRVSSSRGLSFRGLFGGKMGYSYTEVLDEEAVTMLVERACQNAALLEGDDPSFLYDGGLGEYREMKLFEDSLEEVSPGDKILAAMKMEAAAAAHPQVTAVGHCTVATSRAVLRIVNSAGLDLKTRENFVQAYLMPVVKDGKASVDGIAFYAGRDWKAFDPEKTAKKAVENALSKRGAFSVPAGNMPVLLDPEVLGDMLGAFGDMFSAEAAQKGLSRLAGREGEKIAASCFTLTDDPWLETGFASSPFDAQGVPTSPKDVIAEGRLTTLLHNLETAAKAGVTTTGNAAKPGYKGKVGVAASNWRVKPGSRNTEDILEDMGRGIIVTEVSGLHSGANAVTGDFSLTALGYLVEEGVKTRPVNQITIAGNFYDLLRDIAEVADTPRMTMSGLYAPEVWVSSLSVSGE
ncbi:MAG: TldD/PmbA family protein [Christensenellales bacterium]|jgi:PmbA protein